MKLGFLITGLVILLVANVLMLFYKPGSLGPSRSNEGFTSYFLENAGGNGFGNDYKTIGAFDGVKLRPEGKDSSWKKDPQDVKLLNGESKFTPDDDHLFMFAENKCSPLCSGSFSCSSGAVCMSKDQREYINQRGGNRTQNADD